MSQQPVVTIGRIVHYQPRSIDAHSHGRIAPFAAMVTSVDVNKIGLRVFTPFVQDDFDVWAEYSDAPEPGCWSWPPRA